MLDKLIINATIIDGSGAPRRNGSVGFKDGKLVMDPVDTQASEVIDAKGRVVCPGFIDPHSHGDRLIGTEDGRLFKTVQGITTELVGNCGSAYAPVPTERAEEIFNGVDFAHPFDEVKKWSTFEKYLERVDQMKLSANARFYMGHNIIRRAVMGTENRFATKAELENMKALIREGMQAGAAGMSTGLIYVPGCYCDEQEPIELAKVVAEYDGICTSHLRNESDKVIEATEEFINVARKAGVRIDISHHKVQGIDNWGKQKTTLEMIRKANEEEGLHVTCDLYPYPRSMNGIVSCMHPRHQADGMPALVARLADKEYRKQLREEMTSSEITYENFYRNSGGWDGVYIADANATPEAEGHFLSDYAASVGKDPFDAYFDLLIANKGEMQGVYCTMSEDDMCEIVQSPYCVIGTDGCSKSWKDKGHPRAAAAFPQAIQTFVNDKKIFTLEEMIYKMTGLTADRMLVKNKGLLKDGYDADVLILDYDNMQVRATYDKPTEKTEGIDYVFVGGECVYHDLEFTGVYSGKVVRY